MGEQFHHEDENARAPTVVEPTHEEIRAVGTFLRTWEAPAAKPDPVWLAALVADETAIEQKSRAERAVIESQTIGVRLRRLFALGGLLVVAQVRYAANAWSIVLASVLVLSVGFAVSLVSLTTSEAMQTAGAQLFAGLPVTIGACIAAVIGVAFVFTEDDERLLELLAAMPVPPSVVFLARLLLVFGLDCVGALVASIALAGLGVPLLPLVGAWLLPMTLLSALAFILSVWLRNGLFSIFVTVGVWGGITVAMPVLEDRLANLSPALAREHMVMFSLPAIGVPLQVGLILMAVAAVGFTLRALDEDGGILKRSLD